MHHHYSRSNSSSTRGWILKPSEEVFKPRRWVSGRFCVTSSLVSVVFVLRHRHQGFFLRRLEINKIIIINGIRALYRQLASITMMPPSSSLPALLIFAYVPGRGKNTKSSPGRWLMLRSVFHECKSNNNDRKIDRRPIKGKCLFWAQIVVHWTSEHLVTWFSIENASKGDLNSNTKWPQMHEQKQKLRQTASTQLGVEQHWVETEKSEKPLCVHAECA